MQVWRIEFLIIVFILHVGCSSNSSEQRQTTSVLLDTNIDPRVEVPLEEFSPSDTQTFHELVTRTIYDSLLNPHELQLFFTKQEQNNTTVPNTWALAVRVDNMSVADPLDSGSIYAAMFRVVFNDDGSINTTLTDDVLISNWIPVNDENIPNGSLGPTYLSQGATAPVQLPPISSNFVINVERMTQRGLDQGQTIKVTPELELDQTTNVPVGLFDMVNISSFNQKSTHTIIDSLGIEHALALYYIRVDGVNVWNVIAKVAGRDVGDPVLGPEPSIKSFALKFLSNGQLDAQNSDAGLVSNWVSYDSNGVLSGATGPLNVVNGGRLPITSPHDSNFEIDFTGLVLLNP